MRGNRIDDTTGGNSGVEPRVAVIYRETVEKRGYSLEKFVDVVSTTPARMFGLFPRKGAIAVGSDADLILFDPEAKGRITAAAMHMRVDYNPYEGTEVTGRPRTVLSRGTVLVDEGKFVAPPGHGKMLKRDRYNPKASASRELVGVVA